MSYLLNGVDLSTYSIVAGHGESSNISLNGCFDLPSRIGDTYYDWGDEHGIEPYVSDADMIHGGRDIIFNGVIVGTRDYCNTKLQLLYADIKAFSSLTVFSTPYGDFSVMIKTIDPEYYNGVCSFTMTCREPLITSHLFDYALLDTDSNRILDTDGNGIILKNDIELPATGASPYTIDGIPFVSLGLYTRTADLHELADLKEMFKTTSTGEAFQITKRQGNRLVFKGFLKGDSLSDFIQKCKWLYTLFVKSGTRTIVLNNEVTVSCFASDGFQIKNVYIYQNLIVANFETELMIETVTYE